MADDHAVFRDGLRALMEKEPDFEIVGESGTGLETMRIVQERCPDVLLLDLNMPGVGGQATASRLAGDMPDLRIVVLTMHDDRQYLADLLAVGIAGFALKKSHPDVLFQAIRTGTRAHPFIDPDLRAAAAVAAVAEGGRGRLEALSRREREVLVHLAHGLTNNEIAEKLFLSRRTVETHRANLIAKLNLRTRTALVRFAMEHNLLGSM